MSTAIALQDMSAGNGKDHIVRQRAVTRSDSKHSAQNDFEDPWLKEPHDVDTSDIAVDSGPLQPTAVYWITPHGLLTKNITVLDLTKDVSTPYTGLTDAYKTAVRQSLKDHAHTPAITCTRTTWLGLNYNITDVHHEPLATWSHGWNSCRTATLTFPEDSPHSSHPITLNNKRWGLRTEAFTVNSQPFIWESDSLWHSTNMTLFKVVGESKIEVGKYAQKWWGGIVTGGTFILDDKEIDGVVACLTLCVVLKKKRQRNAERRSGGE